MTGYANGGVIPGDPPIRVEVGERLIKADGTVLELVAVEGGVRWQRVGCVDLSNYRLRLERIPACDYRFEHYRPEQACILPTGHKGPHDIGGDS